MADAAEASSTAAHAQSASARVHGRILAVWNQQKSSGWPAFGRWGPPQSALLRHRYLNTDVAEEHVIADRDLLMAHITDLANVMALLEVNELDDRAMMTARHDVVRRYVEIARDDPWLPPPSQGDS